jgi:hypothetical protein
MIYFLSGLLIIHGIVCLVGAFIPLYPPVFFFYAFFPGTFIIKLIIVLLAGAAQLAYGMYLSLRQKRRIRWYWPAIGTVVMVGLLLVFPAIQNPDLFTGPGWGGENRQSIPSKAMAPVSLPITAEGAPDDIIPTADGPEYRANSEVGIESGLLPIESKEIVLSRDKYSPQVTYRDYIATKAGESRNNILHIDTGGREINKLSLYTVDKPDEIEVTEGMRWQRIDEAAVVLTIEVPADVEPGPYVFKISVRINGVDCGAVPCTIMVIEPAIAERTDVNVYHSEVAYLTVALPDGWAAVEGTEPLVSTTHLLGQVAFNSWGEEGFWSREEVHGSSRIYGPSTVMNSLPPGGAYIVLTLINMPPPIGYEPEEYLPNDFIGLLTPNNWQIGSGFNSYFSFSKWGESYELQIACDPAATSKTVQELRSVLESWRFDETPAGNVGWALPLARELIPDKVQPFPRYTGYYGSGENDGIVRSIEAKVSEDKAARFRFTYYWDVPSLGSFTDNAKSSPQHWWDIDVLPDGKAVSVGEGGDPLP